MNIAVIPARGGSKRIPRKNIKIFYNKPMIVRAIDVAQKTGLFDFIVVSTDDPEVAEIALSNGALLPFIRPASLSDDHTPTVPVIAHAILEMNKLGYFPEYVCCIYPCSPFLKNEDLIKSFEILDSQSIDFVYPVVEYPHPIQRAMRRLSSGKMEFFNPQHELTRTQDLEKSFHDAGQFYWGKSSSWIEHKKMHTDGVGMEIPKWRVVDIDTQDDWKRAEILYSALFKE